MRENNKEDATLEVGQKARFHWLTLGAYINPLFRPPSLLVTVCYQT